jgi:hypothetical protein
VLRPTPSLRDISLTPIPSGCSLRILSTRSAVATVLDVLDVLFDICEHPSYYANTAKSCSDYPHSSRGFAGPCSSDTRVLENNPNVVRLRWVGGCGLMKKVRVDSDGGVWQDTTIQENALAMASSGKPINRKAADLEGARAHNADLGDPVH